MDIGIGLGYLSHCLGNLLDFVSLLNAIRVGAVLKVKGKGNLGGIHDLVGQSLINGLGVLKSLFSCSNTHVIDGLVNSSQRGNVDGLFLGHSSSTDSGGVFSGSSIGNGVDEHLNWVLASHQVDDFESLLDDLVGFHFLSGVSSVEHE